MNKLTTELALMVNQRVTEAEDKPENRHKVKVELISKLIEGLVYQVLTTHPKDNVSNSAAMNFVHDNFKELKEDLQYEIAKGFTVAFSEYAGKPFTYLCIIDPELEEANELEC